MIQTDTEKEVKSIRAYPKTCNGCIIHQKDVMISYVIVGEKTTDPIHDLFLTKEQAVILHKELSKAIQ